MFALESAMDELAHALGMDPLDLRLLNHAERDPESGKPWTSKRLRECYEAGAEAIGWRARLRGGTARSDGRPGRLRHGDILRILLPLPCHGCRHARP
jgi:xanthine dehydrogenase YagR molybdenum-binding subunit